MTLDYSSLGLELSLGEEWQHLKQILEYVDLLYYDIKHMDLVRHKELTARTAD